jgi:hypothetical protein
VKSVARSVVVVATGTAFGGAAALIWEVASLMFPEQFFGKEALTYADGLPHFSERTDVRQIVVAVALGVAAAVAAWWATRGYVGRSLE